MSIIQVLVNVTDPSEDGIVIKCDFKPGSVERSIPKRVYLSKVQAGDSRRFFQFPPPIKIEQFFQWA
jgi:hypothetical protein